MNSLVRDTAYQDLKGKCITVRHWGSDRSEHNRCGLTVLRRTNAALMRALQDDRILESDRMVGATQGGLMRLGFGLPQTGQAATAAGVSKVARRAEELGFNSLWVFDRLLYPIKPQAPYPIGDGSLPELYKRVLDPVETLTFVAGQTSRIALGTSVLNLPWYNPALLARRLTTLDVLSGGRLRVGFGIGWMPDEYDAAGVPWKERGKRADEAMDALQAMWTTNPVEVQGSAFKVSKSHVDLKPFQKPHPPIYMAAYTPGAMKRTAREANGWFPVGVPLSAIGPMFDSIKAMV